jgi:regulator of RNase E activity RraA
MNPLQSIMKHTQLSLLIFASPLLLAQDEVPRTGQNFIESNSYTLKEDLNLLEKFDGLRVADVSDGMDKVGLPDVGLVNTEIHPLWKNVEDYSHRIIGIAVTARYVPTQRSHASARDTEGFDAWAGNFYNKYSSEPFVPLLRDGSVVVIDEAEDTDVGSIGSFNILAWIQAGAVGVVTDGTSRDTDEIIAQKVPLYLRKIGRGIRPGRNEIESVNRPVTIGGALVMPGDVIVADGDGVIVVPRKVAADVAEYAQGVIKSDKEGRRGLYKEMGREEDISVKE